MVADRFPEHTLAQCAFKVFAVQTAQRNLLRRVQARFQPAVCGNADAVAVGHRSVTIGSLAIMLILSAWSFKFIPKVFVPALEKQYFTCLLYTSRCV